MEIYSERIDKFSDYFVVCGLDLKTGLEPDFISGVYIHSIQTFVLRHSQ